MSEIRLHPGRFVATLLAIAISVAFMAAISVFASTAQQGLAKSNSLQLSQADLVVTMPTIDPADREFPEPAGPGTLAAIRAVDGVEAVASIMGQPAEITAGDRTQLTNIWLDLPEEFRWAELAEGSYPSAEGEITLAKKGADALQVKVGDTVEMAGAEHRVVGLTNDATTLWGTVSYASFQQPEQEGGASEYVVKVADGADSAAVASALRDAIKPTFADGVVLTADEASHIALVDTTEGFDALKYLLWAFAGIAVLVGMITIANTFTILVTQRRRQLALLRAVGASGGQVAGRLVVESLLLGLIGSLMGVALAFLVATIGAAITGLLFWGLAVNWVEVAAAVVIGTVATMVSAIAPSLAAARVKPLEALQVVPTPAEAKRASRLRIIVCALFLVAGVGAIALSFQLENEMSMVAAIGGSALLTVAVLAGAPLYIAPLLRLIGKIVGRFGPTTRLAMENSARNPRRAAATATALMLAIGLIVTLQVGLASTRSTAMHKIDEEFPLDVAASYADGVPAGVADKVRAVDGVKTVAVVKGKMVQADDSHYVAIDDAARTELGVTGNPIPDGTVRFGNEWAPTDTFTIDGVSYKIQHDQFYPYGTLAVNSATFAKLPGETFDQAVWVKLDDRTSPTALNGVLKVFEDAPGADLNNSGAQIASVLEQIIGVILIVMTALLGVAVLIAIVGVGNTLGLSVLERQRESALLRALGMQRGQLRQMLLIEAFALVGVGAVIGFVAGLFFGWLGLTTIIGIAKASGGIVIDSKFALDPWWTLALIAVCVISAVLASLLPGRKAANATPTEALAVD
ncbi:MAG TPA: FtsX-like permease family protein [Tessaracoccus flavescens]|uniref:FtsX-like permease family protein n=1 Tax=Tessaracoccus flavescens TaxID=399497 RepID=A0A921EQ51_9ACTN|nr:FtsX-like permease family protein [Tessaracoccus flavescens]